MHLLKNFRLIYFYSKIHSHINTLLFLKLQYILELLYSSKHFVSVLTFKGIELMLKYWIIQYYIINFIAFLSNQDTNKNTVLSC